MADLLSHPILTGKSVAHLGLNAVSAEIHQAPAAEVPEN